MTDDKVIGVFYATRSDGVNLYRFAVPNTKTGDEWDKPQFKIRQDQTGVLYDEAIDVEMQLIPILKQIYPQNQILIHSPKPIFNKKQKHLTI